MSKIEYVPGNAKAVVGFVRQWDGETTEFFVLKVWRTSPDYLIDGTPAWYPAAAVARQVTWKGPQEETEAEATAAARNKAKELYRAPTLPLFVAPP